MNIVFERLPETLEELKACPYGQLEKPEYTAALYIAAMCVYPKDKEAAHEMVRYLNGPNGLSEFEKQFIADRMRDGDYVPRSFFKGTSPENNYTPSQPYTVAVETTPYSYQNEGYARLWLRSSGADNPRQIDLRLKPSANQWFISQAMLLGQIRMPKEQDPWA